MASNWSNVAPAADKPPRISWRELRSLPSRLCTPPPAVGNARSFGVTPIFEVQLEDVLSNKLLPPLSLRDFEQYLLFVGGHPEFLYFVLWLRDYTTRYKQWSSVAKKTFRSSLKNSPGDARRGHPEHSSSLASFFYKAQQTFFVKGAQYELDVPPDVLAPFASFDSTTARWKCQYGAHPDPDVFNELSQMAHQRLKIALNHCVLTNYTNVGNGRARCGIMAGTFFTVVGTVPPLALNFCRGLTRWERLASIPGFFLGLTILIASLHGVCIMIWIFGDFRQLRKFEYEAAVEKMPEPLSGYRFPALNEKTARSPTDLQSPSRAIPQPLKLHAISRFQPSLAPIAACDEPVPPSPSGTQHSVPELSRRASSVSGFLPITPVRTYFPPTIPQLAQTRPVKIVTPEDRSFMSYSTISFKHPISSEALLASRRGSCPETVAHESRCSGTFSGEEHDEDSAPADSDAIEISEAFFDERPDPSSPCLDKPLAIPAASVMANEFGQYISPDGRKLSYSSQYQTATFIPISVSGSQYSHGYGDDIEAGNDAPSAEPLHFDFEGLPSRNWAAESRRGSRRSSVPPSSRPDNGISYSSRRSSVISVPGISTRYDESGDVTPNTAGVQSEHRHVSTSAASSDDLDTPHWLSVVDNVLLKVYRAPDVDPSMPSLPSEEIPIVTTRLHEMLSVPAFASPLTRVLNPVVTRAQWEIVVRSAAVSVLATVIVEVVLVALPVPH